MSSDDDSDHDGLSAYERQRLANIEKNKAVLESLGLLDGGLFQRKGGGGKARVRRVVEKPAAIQRPQRAVHRPQRLSPGFRAPRIEPVEMVPPTAAPAVRKLHTPEPIRTVGLLDLEVIAHFSASKAYELTYASPVSPALPLSMMSNAHHVSNGGPAAGCDGEYTYTLGTTAAVTATATPLAMAMPLHALPIASGRFMPSNCSSNGEPEAVPGAPVDSGDIEIAAMDVPCEADEAPQPAVDLDEYVHAAARAARLKRRHTMLRREGVLDRLRREEEVAAEAAHGAATAAAQAALEAAAQAFEVSLPGATVVWVHVPMVIDVGRSSPAAARGCAARSAGNAKVSLVATEWVEMNGQQSEEEVEMEIAAEVDQLRAELRAEERATIASGAMPKPSTLRHFIFDAMVTGLRDREGIAAYVAARPDVISEASDLRAAVVTVLGKEKNQKAPLFRQEGTRYPLTRIGRLASGQDLNDDDGDEELPDPEHSTTAGAMDATTGVRAEAAAVPAPAPPPRPPDEWTWVKEGEFIDVEVSVNEGDDPMWAMAVVTTVLVDGSFEARIELPDSSDEWNDWFTWEEEGKDWRRHATQPPPKKWKWVREGDMIDVEVSALAAAMAALGRFGRYASPLTTLGPALHPTGLYPQR